MVEISSDVIRGYNDTVILSILMKAPSYGYEISERRAQYGPNNVPRETLMKSILEFAGSIEFITRKDVQDKFDVGSTKAFLCLKKLCDDGKLIQHNMGRQTTYSLNRF